MRNTDILELSLRELTPLDLCDRCMARAYVLVQLLAGGEILFCAHHGREHLPMLAQTDALIRNESYRLPAGVPGSNFSDRSS